MDKRIKNIIFDFGGIIVDLNKQAAVHAFEALGFNAGDYIDNYVQSGVFAAMEVGKMSTEEFCSFVCKETGQMLDCEDIRRAWNGMLVQIPVRRLQMIRSLRSQYRTYVLSNTNEMHWSYGAHELLASSGLKLEDCFDRFFLSYELGLAKPDVEIFRKVMSMADLSPEETFFIDDSVENCRVAESVGFHVFHSVQPEDWMELF